MIAEVLPPDSPLPPELQKVGQEVSALEARVAALVIETPEQHEAACGLENTLGAKLKQAEELTDPAVKAAHDAHKKAVAVQKALCDPLRRAKLLLRSRIGEYREHQRRLVEAQRLEAERAAAAAAETEALARAARLENEGRTVEAEAALRVQVPAVSVAAPKIEANGVSTREVWSAEVIDLFALIRYVAEDPAARPFLAAAMPALNAQARSLKGALNIPGVRPVKRHA